MRPRTAREVFGNLVESSLFFQMLSSRRDHKPGEAINKLTTDERVVLSQLKSDDIKDDGLMSLNKPIKRKRSRVVSFK